MRTPCGKELKEISYWNQWIGLFKVEISNLVRINLLTNRAGGPTLCAVVRSLGSWQDTKSPSIWEGDGGMRLAGLDARRLAPGSLTIDGSSRGADGDRSPAPTFHRGGHTSVPCGGD